MSFNFHIFLRRPTNFSPYSVQFACNCCHQYTVPIERWIGISFISDLDVESAGVKKLEEKFDEF